jgi:hypothetical protein
MPAEPVAIVAFTFAGGNVGILDKTTNVGIILVCGAVIADIGYRNFGPRSVEPSAAAARQRPNLVEYKPGETLSDLPGFTSRPGERSLLFVVKSSCPYCTDSMPFYQRVVQEVRTAKSPVQLVGVCLEPKEACEAYFKRHSLTMDVTVGIPPGTLKIVGTPTLLLVDDGGKVTASWAGALPAPGQQQAVLDATLARKPGNS